MSQKFPDYRIFVCRRPNGAPTNLTNDENPKPSGPVALLHIARSRSPNRTGRHAEIRRNKTLPGTTHDPRKRHPDDSGHLCADTCHRRTLGVGKRYRSITSATSTTSVSGCSNSISGCRISGPRTGSPLDVSLAQKQIRGVLDVAPDACSSSGCTPTPPTGGTRRTATSAPNMRTVPYRNTTNRGRRTTTKISASCVRSGPASRHKNGNKKLERNWSNSARNSHKPKRVTP